MSTYLTTRVLPLSLAVSAAITANSTIAQENPAREEEVLEVIGIRQSLDKSMDLKRHAASIQDSIVAEDIGKFPDQNVAESLQRITGVAISRENGEGSKITVRGFGPKFNLVQLNGRTIATSDFGREFDFQVLPAELISGADVVKASRANVPEGSLGAYVNTRTARPLDNPGLQIVGAVQAKYQDQAEEVSPKYSIVASNTFADDTLGVLFGLSVVESENRIDSFEGNRWNSFQADNTDYAPGPIQDENGNAITSGAIWYPGRAAYMMVDEKRERTSANLTVQWSPSESFENTFDLLYSDFSREQFSNSMQVPLQIAGWTDVIVSENRTAIAGRKDASPIDGLFLQLDQESETLATGLNSKFESGAWSFEADIAYSKAESEPRTNTFVPHLINHTVDQSVPGQEGGLIPGQDNITFDSRVGDVMVVTSTIDWGNPASVRTHWNDVRHNERSDEVTEAKLDASVELNMGPLNTLDMGIAYTDREKKSELFTIRNGCGNLDLGAPGTPEFRSTCGTAFDLPDELFAINSAGDFLDEVSGSIPRDFVLIPDIGAYIDAIGALRMEPEWAEESLNAPATINNTEEDLALYIQANFEGDFGDIGWSGNIGVRYVETETSSTGWAQELLTLDPTWTADDDPSTLNGFPLVPTFSDIAPISASTEYSNVLPSANFVLDFNSGLYLKTALAKVMTRPALEDIGVNRNYFYTRAESYASSGGNPDLRPYEATQFDFAVEYYAESGSAYALNFFYKDISDFISTRTYTQDTGVDFVYFGDLIETITEKDNRDGGTVKGFEIAALHYFDYLPGLFGGFGVQANYTYTDSEDDGVIPFEREAVRTPSSGLEGFSENAYNLIAFYDQGGFQARLAYNWRDTYLKAREGQRTRGLPEHVQDYGQWDFSTSYDVNDNVTITGEIINLTNENILEYADIRERVTYVEYSGVRYQLGARVKF